MSVADLVQRLQNRPDTTPQALPDAAGAVRTVAPGANTGFQAVRTPKPAPALGFRPVFAPVALFAPETVEVWENFGESVPAGAADRPYTLTRAEGDAAHAEPWDDAAIGLFVARVGLFLRRGIDADDADDIAERLHLRDAQMDDRRPCLECIHLAGRAGAWRCGNHRAAQVMRELPDALATRLQRCPSFRASHKESNP